MTEIELDEYWSEGVLDDAKEVGTILGIDIDNIYWSGFCSQVDGACFEGAWSYAEGSCENIIQYAPKDKALHQMAERLRVAVAMHQLKFGGDSWPRAVVQHVGHYYHSRSVDIEVDPGDGWGELGIDLATVKEIRKVLRDFMDWIYKQLKNEYVYQYELEQKGLEAEQWEA